MEKLLNAIETSKSTVTSFQEYIKKNQIVQEIQNFNLKIFPSILTSFRLSDPREMEDIKSIFKGFAEYETNFQKFYGIVFRGRQLIWLYDVSRVTLSGIFVNGEKEFRKMKMLMASVLLIFNKSSKDKISIREIKAHFQSKDEKMIKRCLFRLKTIRIIRIKDEHVFLRDKFPSKKKIIDCSQMKAIQKIKNEKITQDRRVLIESLIVRKMKKEKRMKIQELLLEVGRSITLFRPSIRIIKSRIENLIEREYLKRDEKDIKFVIYIE